MAEKAFEVRVSDSLLSYGLTRNEIQHRIAERRTDMNAVTINHARQDLEHLIGQVISDADPVIICKDNGDKAVLMSLDDFNSWQETLYLLSSPANAEHLRKSMAEAEAGKIVERELIET